MSKLFIIFAVIFVVVIGGAMYSSRQNVSTPQPLAANSEIAPTVSMGSTAAESPEAGSMKGEHVMIRAIDSGFFPASIMVKKGTTVIFLNGRGSDVWPASAMHPTHALYPTKGGCIGSAFDACRALKTGESWSFTFNIAGTWKYHDHLNPKSFGSITVE